MRHILLKLVGLGFCLGIPLVFSSCGRVKAEPVPDKTKKLLQAFVDELVEITPGEGKFPASFQMGYAKGPAEVQPVHEVQMAGKFSISLFETPQNLFEAVMGFNHSHWKGARNSAESMSFREATDFCDQITELLHQEKLIPDSAIIRLPTEAEWEYCCRAGTASAYSFGDKSQAEGEVSPKASLLDKYGWHTGNAAGNDPAVGALAPNPWGLYDMHGYLWEMTLDGWHDDYTGAPATSWPAWSNEQIKSIVLKGGSWKETHDKLQSSSRRKEAPVLRDDAIGFRCVLSEKQ